MKCRGCSLIAQKLPWLENLKVEDIVAKKVVSLETPLLTCEDLH